MAFSLIALSGAAAGLAALTHLRALARETAAEAAYPPSGQFVTVDGRQMHVRVDGAGPDLVLIHGSSGSLRDFTFSLVPGLRDRYRVIAIDRPGLGWSDFAPGAESLVVQARLMQGAAAAVGATRPVVLGHSYGGAVALAWAVDMPDRLSALVLASTPSHRWESGLPMFYRITSHPLGRALAVPLLTAFVPKSKVTSELEGVFDPQSMPEGYATHFGPAMALRRDALRANARQRRALKAGITAMMPHYPDLDLPVEIVHGTADTTVGLEIHARKLAADVPGARLTALPGVGHMVQHVAVPQLTAAIDRAAARAGLR